MLSEKPKKKSSQESPEIITKSNDARETQKINYLQESPEIKVSSAKFYHDAKRRHLITYQVIPAGCLQHAHVLNFMLGTSKTAHFILLKPYLFR